MCHGGLASASSQAFPSHIIKEHPAFTGIYGCIVLYKRHRVMQAVETYLGIPPRTTADSITFWSLVEAVTSLALPSK